MNFRPLKLGGLATAIAAVLASPVALALNPAATESAQLKIYVSGGGAADGNLEATVKALLDNADTYTYGGNKRSFWAVSGTLKNPSPVPGVAAGTTVAFYKRTLGAAFTSTTVPAGTPIEHLRTTLATGTRRTTTWRQAPWPAASWRWSARMRATAIPRWASSLRP